MYKESETQTKTRTFVIYSRKVKTAESTVPRMYNTAKMYSVYNQQIHYKYATFNNVLTLILFHQHFSFFAGFHNCPHIQRVNVIIRAQQRHQIDVTKRVFRLLYQDNESA